MIGPTCPTCGRVGHPTIALNRFHELPAGYRAMCPDVPVRPTRAEAEADQCAWQARRSGAA